MKDFTKYLMISIFFSVLFLDCKSKDFDAKEYIEIKEYNYLDHDTISCEDIIKEIVRGSNLDLSRYNEKYLTRVEDIKTDSLSIQVYVENNISDDPNEKQIVESTIAWLVYVPSQNKLINVTVNPENPIEISFKKNNIKKIDVSNLCGVPKKEEKSVIKIEDDCKEFNYEMTSGEVCIIKNSNIEDEYKKIVTNHSFDGSQYLIEKLPIHNQDIEVNKDGIISISYTVSDGLVKIELLFEGGRTEFRLEQISNNVKRRIIFNAD